MLFDRNLAGTEDVKEWINAINTVEKGRFATISNYNLFATENEQNVLYIHPVHVPNFFSHSITEDRTLRVN